MTTTNTASVNDFENSFLSPSMYNIQYPNCQRGMFSLREPFKDMSTAVLPTRDLSPETVQPTYLNDDPVEPIEEQPIEPVSIPSRQKSKRNASVQCSLLTPNVHHDMAVQTKIDRQRTAVNPVYDDNDTTPQYYYLQKKIQPIEEPQEVYEIWDVESPSPSLRAIPINQKIRRKEVPQARHVGRRKPIIEYVDEDVESDYDDERVVYAHRPRKTIKKTYLPPNVRMICVRDDANEVSY